MVMTVVEMIVVVVVVGRLLPSHVGFGGMTFLVWRAKDNG